MFTDEWLKLRSVRTTWLLLAAAPVLVLLGVIGKLSHGDLTDPATIREAVAHAGVLALLPLVLGIMSVAGEHRHRTITDTYLGRPRRDRVLLAKLAVNTLAGVVFGLAGVLTGLVAVAIWLPAKGVSLDLAEPGLWRTVVGSIAWNALFAGIGVAVGALIRNLATAIAAALAWLALVEGLVAQLLGNEASRWLPFRAGSSLADLPIQGESLGQWTALAVLIGYAALLTLLAARTTNRADVA
ncbi:MAG TPA: ABC transporter permease subunit [Asanoa sp.]|nr:ABC transporter permease subunit [Asanoa sp.]